MRSQPTLKRKICGDTFLIKPLHPVDFIGRDKNISFFTVKQPQTMYDRVKELQNQRKENKYQNELEVLRTVLDIGVLVMGNKIFNVDDYLKSSNNLVQACALRDEVIDISFSIKEQIELSNELLKSLDLQASRYGKTPAEILWPTGGYTAMDAYTLNMVVASLCVNDEIKAINKGGVQLVYAFRA